MIKNKANPLKKIQKGFEARKNEKTDEAIDWYALENEVIISKLISGNVSFYVTNKRVIRHEETPFSESMYAMFYKHIISVLMRDISYLWLVVVGIASIICAFFFENSLSASFRSEYQIFQLVCILSGLMAIFVGITYKPTVIQFIIPATQPPVNKLTWRIDKKRKLETQRFIKEVQRQITKENNEYTRLRVS